MEVLFIADLHLSEKKPKIVINFLHFLDKIASQAKILYILGDFFDYWIGDDDRNLLQIIISEELKKLQNKGIHCYFIHGNHDFLLGKDFAEESGMILLPEEKVLKINNYNILILHGDTLCTSDITYQRYRKHVSNQYLQRLFLMLPLSTRRYIAKIIRKNSKTATKFKLKCITDVNKETVIEKFKKYQVDLIIHGHTHNPNIHEINIDGKILYRAVLGSWHHNASMIKVKAKSIELLYF